MDVTVRTSRMILIVVVLLTAVATPNELVTIEEQALVTIKPREYPRALRNPIKGFRARRGVFDHEWATLWHSYIRWNEIENDHTDGMDKILTFCNQHWQDAEKHNIKVIPRVYLDWNEKEGNEYWPADMRTGDYSSEQFKRRVVRLVRRLGVLWDNDPRVAFIEMGIIGYWGEHHNPRPSYEMQELLGLVFTQAFKNKKVAVRHPWDFTNYEFGIHWDSWAHIQQVRDHGEGIAELNAKTGRWRTCPIGGECAYDWGRYQQQPGDNPNDTLRDSIHREHLIHTIRWLHCTQLGWVADYDQKDPEVCAGAQEVQKAFGYRYILDKVCYPVKISPDKVFKVSFVVRNVGSAPFYYEWPVEVSLLDPKTRLPVWQDRFKDIDIRQWLPGDRWDKTTKSYDLKPKDYQVDGTFQLPQTVKSGEYIVALAILDPAGMVPSVRFATENYFEGGRHPIGLVGVDKMVLDPVLDTINFDDPAEDRTLEYVYDTEQYPIGELSDPHLSLQEAAAIKDIDLVRSLLDKGVEVDSRDGSIKKTALQHAAISGHKDIVELLLAKGADVDAGNFHMGTPLHYASQEGYREIAELLIAKGANINAKNENGQTPLDIATRDDIRKLLLAKGATVSSIHVAVQMGDIDKVKTLLRDGADPNQADERGLTPLHHAAQGGHKEIADLLIGTGADVNAGGTHGYPSLYYAIWFEHPEIVQLLVNKGTDVSLTPEKDYPPIYYAVWNDDLDTVKLLVGKGARFDVKVLDDRTAFHYAVGQGSREIVEFFLVKGMDIPKLYLAACRGDLEGLKILLEEGAGVDAQDELGWTPLCWAASMGREDVGAFLLSKGAKADAKTQDGDTLLHQAAYSGASGLAERLIAKGADVQAKDKRGRTPLHAAASAGRREVVELLLAEGADVNARTTNGWTPLHVAALAGHTEVVELLIGRGADASIKNAQGRSPADFARQRGHKEIVEFLERRGAKE